MWTWVVGAVVAAAGPIVSRGELERVAPAATWTTTSLPALEATLVTLPTKGPNRFVVKGERAAVATVDAAAPLFAPLDRARAGAVVDALEGGVVVDNDAVDRVAAAGFAVSRPPPPEPSRFPFSFTRLTLRDAESAPALVLVVVDLDVEGHVDRHEHVVARVDVDDVPVANAPLRKAGAVDRSVEIARFVAAARGRR